MKIKLPGTDVRNHDKVRKAALLSIAVNVLEIVAGIVMVILVNRMLTSGVEETLARMPTWLAERVRQV